MSNEATDAAACLLHSRLDMGDAELVAAFANGPLLDTPVAYSSLKLRFRAIKSMLFVYDALALLLSNQGLETASLAVDSPSTIALAHQFKLIGDEAAAYMYRMHDRYNQAKHHRTFPAERESADNEASRFRFECKACHECCSCTGPHEAIAPEWLKKTCFAKQADGHKDIVARLSPGGTPFGWIKNGTALLLMAKYGNDVQIETLRSDVRIRGWIRSRNFALHDTEQTKGAAESEAVAYPQRLSDDVSAASVLPPRVQSYDDNTNPEANMDELESVDELPADPQPQAEHASGQHAPNLMYSPSPPARPGSLEARAHLCLRDLEAGGATSAGADNHHAQPSYALFAAHQFDASGAQIRDGDGLHSDGDQQAEPGQKRRRHH